MSVMKSKDGNDLMVDCSCGCDEGIRIRIDRRDDDSYAILTYTNGNFDRDQKGVFSTLGRKWRKILAILRNKDYCYSEICMSREDMKLLTRTLARTLEEE